MPGGGGGGSSDRGRGRAAAGERHHRSNRKTTAIDRETQISKTLSLILRHRAKELGLAMDDRGFVKVDELLQHHRLRSLKVSLPDVKRVVESNAKQRFELVVLPPLVEKDAVVVDSGLDNPANFLIRATQGHSIQGLDVESLLTPVLLDDPDCPKEVVHGTYAATWPAILASGGLRPMGRVHVHFATGVPEGKLEAKSEVKSEVKDGEIEETKGVSVVPGAPPVVSGMRASASLLVWVDVRRASEGGVRWWRSRNGVVLTEGLATEKEKEGVVPLEYVSRVVERKSGKVIWKSEWWEESNSG